MTSIEYRVPYADTDQMKVVYYANYLVYFERLRNELLRNTGCTYFQMEEEGYALPVIEAVCHYKASAKYDDLLTISGWVAEVKGVRVTIACEVRRGEELLVSGHTVHACIDMNTGRPCRVPASLAQAVEQQGR
ncbi:MAG: acyl-CoA thioesterase [Lentisphaeria bacterium]|nr:acyl-CoA thioesterase [Lentisphaeria bacterium]